MKRVADLKHGDIISFGGVDFAVDAVYDLPNGEIRIMCEYILSTPENMAAYGELLRNMKECKEREDHEIQGQN